MRLGFLLLIFPLSLLSWSCDNVDNNDATEEVPCTQVTGTWMVAQATCGDIEKKPPFATFTFDSEELITQTFGGSDCQRIYSATATHTVPAIATVGFGNFRCLVNETPVDSCAGTDTSCDSIISAENRTNSFPICVLKNDVDLSLTRTASSEDISSGVSYCDQAGQKEILSLRRQQTGLAVLSISDGSIYDFGSTPVGTPVYKTFTVTNSGDTSARAVATTNLPSPFLYGGGAYPGVGGGDTGDCGTEILPGSCSIVIVFNPEVAGNFDQNLSLSYDNGVGIVETSRALTGVGQ